MKFYANGRPVRESTGTDDKETAKRILKTREGAAAAGQPVLPRVDRMRYEEVAGGPPDALRDNGVPPPRRG
jgi:hypothetical protein